MMGCWGRSKFAVVVLVIQTLFLILFAAFAEYGYEVAAEPRWFYPSKWDWDLYNQFLFLLHFYS